MNPDLSSLEWQSLLRHYSSHCLSAPAKAVAQHIEPSNSPSNAESALDLTQECFRALEDITFGGLAALDPLEPVLERLVRCAVLDGKDLFSLARMASITSELRTQLTDERSSDSYPRLFVLAGSIPPLGKLAEPVFHAIDEKGTVRDTASPILRSLRDQERRLHSDARNLVESVLQQAVRDGYVQEKFYDFRDGRYLIPIKNEFKNKFHGLVVESSSTRATVFMEPSTVRETNDKIKQAQLLIEEEIYRILEDLSRHLHPHAINFKSAYDLAIEIDLAQGRASLAKAHDGIRGVSRPEFSDHFDIENLYHPLLGFVIEPEKVIRNSFRLGPDRTVLIISGPNTGGKTVLLKAVGLSCLMARAGFFISCAGRARVPFCNEVLAQIGDSQNLELSLSSFSGSVQHLKEILTAAKRGSLVLIDEILHATDPDEATALSRAILEELSKRSAFAIVTTHLNGLKVSGEGLFESASMEFDPHLLSPTYRLRTGVPGSSRALEIALKLGLDPRLVDYAKSFLSAEKISEQRAVDQLESKERELQIAKNELANAKSALEEERLVLNRLREELELSKKSFRSDALKKIRDQERTAISEVEKLISEYKKRLQSIDEKHSATMMAQTELEEARKPFREAERVLDEFAPPRKGTSRESKPLKASNAAFQLNGPVHVLSLDSDGILLTDPVTDPQQKKSAEIMVGKMRMKIAWSQMIPKTAPGPTGGSTGIRSYSEAPDAPPEIHLLGRRVDEALDMLSSYLDRAALSGRPSVRIVHGHGSGALKKAVREFLKRARYQIKFRPGTEAEGGEGCTVVEFP